MSLEELLKERERLLKQKEINTKKLDKINSLIEYYTWSYNSLLYEKSCYNDNIYSYKKILNRSKVKSLFDFSLFDTNFDKYFIKRIEYFEKKIEVVDKKKSSISNLIVIKKGEKKHLENENREIDVYLEYNNKCIENLENQTVLVKNSTFDK
ncbi:MAG: hypothetical protein IKE75_04025 [Bacilli bacterium]|nr:hypothetical protein [Bacilli bacterium]